MKTYLNKVSLLAALAFAGLTAIPAQATLVVRITDGAGVQTFQVGNANCPGCTANSIVATAADANFSFSLHIATSNAPTGTNGAAILTADSIITSNSGSIGTPNNLKLEVSDTGFLVPSGTAALVQRGTTNEPANGFATGTVSSAGYYGTGAAGNVLFCQAVGTCSGNSGTLSFPSFALNTQQDQNNIAFVTPFSLDEVINFSFTSAGFGQYTANLSTVQVPEPASVVFLATMALGFGGLFRKKLQAKRS
jgi:hypothetical protein